VLESTPTVRALLSTELRESLCMLEASLSWSQCNWRLAMHNTRLGQLCRELEQRGADDVLEIVRAGPVLWASHSCWQEAANVPACSAGVPRRPLVQWAGQ
jgi:hypothetical protein